MYSSEQKSVIKVTVVTIINGNRWCFLSQVVDVVMKDSHVNKLIIVDNGSENNEEIIEGTRVYGERITVLRQDKNKGSAGGFSIGLDYSKKIDCDFVLILDDDSVPEDGFIDSFLSVLDLFPGKNKKIVLHGNRVDLPGNKDIFYEPIRDIRFKGTFFEIFSINKIIYLIRTFFNFSSNGQNNNKLFKPVIPNEGFVYGATFLPIEAVRETKLPDSKLFLYGDDIEYSWQVIKNGYDVYLCSNPKFTDVDVTFPESHILGLFSEKMLEFKVFFRMRNMVIVSRRNTKQNAFVLALSIITWYLFLCFYIFVKLGISKLILRRLKLIAISFYKGFNLNFSLPKNLKFPDNAQIV